MFEFVLRVIYSQYERTDLNNNVLLLNFLNFTSRIEQENLPTYSVNVRNWILLALENLWRGPLSKKNADWWAGRTRLRCSLLHDPNILASAQKQDEYWPSSFILSLYDFPRKFKNLTRSELINRKLSSQENTKQKREWKFLCHRRDEKSYQRIHVYTLLAK